MSSRAHWLAPSRAFLEFRIFWDKRQNTQLWTVRVNIGQAGNSWPVAGKQGSGVIIHQRGMCSPGIWEHRPSGACFSVQKGEEVQNRGREKGGMEWEGGNRVGCAARGPPYNAVAHWRGSNITTCQNRPGNFDDSKSPIRGPVPGPGSKDWPLTKSGFQGVDGLQESGTLQTSGAL